MESKYNIGDLLRYKTYDGEIKYLFVTRIEEFNGNRLYFNETGGNPIVKTYVYEDDVLDCFNKGSQTYKDYIQYLDLKKRFES